MRKSPGCGRSRVRMNWPSWNGAAQSTGASWKRTCRAMLREGMNEAEFACDLYSLLVREGHQGTVRFGMFNVDIAVAQLGFGENSIYPTSFDGPGGCVGICPAAPVLGSRDRSSGWAISYSWTSAAPWTAITPTKRWCTCLAGRCRAEVMVVHRRCLEIERRLAAQLKPGAIPSEIYAGPWKVSTRNS